ncbi:MAG TPA: hypothetical protein V6C76_12880 [Drouetiella sp.]
MRFEIFFERKFVFCVVVLVLTSPASLAKFIPPFPPLVPANQSDYEQTLSFEERAWIHQVKQKIEGRIAGFVALRDAACDFGMSSQGKFVEPLICSTEISTSEKDLIIATLNQISFPYPPVNSKVARARVGFDHSNGVSFVRMTKRTN